MGSGGGWRRVEESIGECRRMLEKGRVGKRAGERRGIPEREMGRGMGRGRVEG